jgi:hypothetical protein
MSSFMSEEKKKHLGGFSSTSRAAWRHLTRIELRYYSHLQEES